MKNERGDWFLSFSGNKIYPLDLTPEDIRVDDIVHALSNICRFGGHCREFYSVAQHSVLVSWCVPKAQKLSALLHDATEAYCGDMVRPLKHQMPAYIEMEKKIWTAVAKRFGLDEVLPLEVEWADARVLLAEKRDLLQTNGHVWSFPQCRFPDLDPYPRDRIDPLTPSESKSLLVSALFEAGVEW